jgi:hypothetical protein
MKLSLFLPVAMATSLAQTLPLEAQEPIKPLPETKIVLRVSRKFIHRLVGTGFQREEPINSNVDGVAVAGTALVSGRFQITLHESKTESEFDVLVSGEVSTLLTARRRPVEVHAHGAASFSGRRRFVHKGDLLAAEKMTLDARNQFTLDEICARRGGPAGAVTRRIARPFVRRGLAEGDHMADDEIRARLTPALETELDKLLAALNQIPPMVKQAHAVIIMENKLPPEGVRTYHAATKDHLLFSVGRPDRHIPSLPNLDKDKEAPLELWIGESKNAPKEEHRKFLLQNWRLIAPVLLMQLERRSPELAKEVGGPLAKLLEEVDLHEVPGWHVVTFAPKILAPTIKVP